MVDPVRTSRIHEKEIQADLARMEMIEALRHGNVYEVMKKLPPSSMRDFDDFMGEQYKAFKSMMQDYEIYKLEAQVPEVSLSDLRMHDENASMRQGEGAEFVKGMITSFQKTAVKAGTLEDGDVLLGDEEGQDLTGLTEGTLDEWDSFMGDVWGQIIDQQFVADYTKKMSELQKELREIIALAKTTGDVESILIALVKVNQTKNGCLMTWLGKKAFMTNESMNKIADDLKLSGSADSGAIMDAQAKTRDGSFQLNLLVSDMQKVVQDSASVLEQVKGYMDELNRTRREIITKISAH